ncbi:MAG: hypothetical protein ACLR8P_03660 [Clostridium fessum]
MGQITSASEPSIRQEPKDANAVTPEALAEICQAVDIPVVAIGGTQ